MNPLHLTMAVLLGAWLAAPPVRGERPSLFDPERHMRVDDVRPGMRGYGLSVFSGTEIDRFDVEVVSVLRNYNPRRHVILIRCAGQNLEHTGAVQGMSGSPVFLRDEAGQERMIGAFAYGWALAKDPIAGVQPIEYMLDLPADRVPTTAPAAASVGGRYDVLSAVNRPWRGVAEPARTSGDAPLVRMSTPLCAAGFPAALIDRFRDDFAASGLTLLRGAAGGGARDGMEAEIAPGSVVVVPLLTGDAEIHANGTCTEVIGDRVFAFGHPFNNQGEIFLPLAGGGVHTVIASLSSSFKIAGMGRMRGTLVADETVGVAGRLGDAPVMLPIRVRVTRPDAQEPIEYNFQSVRHPQFLPILTVMALAAALTGDSELPQYNSVEYDIAFTFDGDRRLRIRNLDANLDAAGLIVPLAGPIAAAAENPFASSLPTRIDAELRISSESREAQILSVQVPRARYRPGDRLEAFVTYRPFRGDEATMPVSIVLPRDLPDGTYSLAVGDWMRHLTDESTAQPFRFTAENVAEVFEVLQDIASIRHDALYVRLLRQPDGVAVGRVAMQLLPSSRRQVLLGAGRSNVTPFVSSDVTVIPTPFVMSGSADFSIKVERRAKVEADPTTRPATP